jgi:hypothetical protein
MNARSVAAMSDHGWMKQGLPDGRRAAFSNDFSDGICRRAFSAPEVAATKPQSRRCSRRPWFPS